MKINIHADQYIAPSQTPANRPATSPASGLRIPADQLPDTSAGSSVSSTLTDLAASRAARVTQLASLYASGRYVVNSAQLAQSLVSGALSR